MPELEYPEGHSIRYFEYSEANNLTLLPQYTVSIGAAQLLPNESFSHFLERGDAALYKAKAAGRNRVVSV
jgi:PleD family two-component response regulator